MCSAALITAFSSGVADDSDDSFLCWWHPGPRGAQCQESCRHAGRRAASPQFSSCSKTLPGLPQSKGQEPQQGDGQQWGKERQEWLYTNLRRGPSWTEGSPPSHPDGHHPGRQRCCRKGPGPWGQSRALRLSTRLCRSTARPTRRPHMPNDSPTLSVPLENDPVNYLHFTAEEAQLQSSRRARGPAGQEHCTERSVGQRQQIHGHGSQKHRSSKTHLAPSHAETEVSSSHGFSIFGSASPAVLLKASPLEDSSARPPKEPGIAVHGTKSKSAPAGMQKWYLFQLNTKAALSFLLG